MLTFISLILYPLAFFLDRLFGVTFFRVLPGLWVLYFLPGYLLLPIFRLKDRLRQGERFLLSVSFSLIISGLLPLVLFGLGFRPLSQTVLIVAQLLLVTILGLLATRFPRPKKEPLQYSLHAPLILAMILFLIVQIGNFVLYPFIPEIDGYSLIGIIRALSNSTSLITITHRPLFPLLCLSTSALSGLNLLTIFKYFFPLLTTITLIPVYLEARIWLKKPFPLFLATILPLTFPVFVAESDIVRPQTIIIILCGIILWLLLRFLRTTLWLYFYLALALSLAAFGFHELGLYCLLTTVGTAVPAAWRFGREKPRTMYLGVAALILLAFVAIYTTPVWGYLHYFLYLLFKYFRLSNFRLWFINNYQNTDHNQMGWPGFSFLLYYGYNLGLAAGYLLLVWLLQRQKASQQLSFLPVYIFIAIGLVFAEVFPRFGFAYVPDRAWLFIVTGLCFLFPAFLSRIPFSKASKYGVVCVVALSIGTSWVVTYLKQGWVTPGGYQAAQWLAQNTPSDSDIISQAGNSPIIEIYAERKMISQSSFFLMDTADQAAFIQKIVSPHVYVLYSSQTSSTLYHIRSWWNTYNASTANLDTLQSLPLKKVYDHDGIFIWQYQ
jgi:hypothetical protein